MKKLCIFLLVSLCMLLGCPLRALAADIKLYDEGGRLESDQFAACEQILRTTADTTGLDIAVIIGVENRTDLTIETLCESSYLELFGEHSNGVLYYMDLKGYNPCDHITTRGLGQFYITNSEGENRVEAIFDALDEYLYPVGNENAFGAVAEFANQVSYYYQAGIPEKYWVYDDKYHEYYHVEDGELVATAHNPYPSWIFVIFMTLIFAGLGLIISALVSAIIKSHYKFKWELSPTTYVNKKKVQYHQQKDVFVKTYTNRVRIDTDSGRGGSGGGGGGGHSSGGFGGGSHHR